VSRVPNATNELKKIVEHHIYEMGVNTIERVSGTAINVSEFILSSDLFRIDLFRIQKFILKQ
jgi:hypothetical protein